MLLYSFSKSGGKKNQFSFVDIHVQIGRRNSTMIKNNNKKKRNKTGGKNLVEWFQHSILSPARSQVFCDSKHDSDMGFRHGKKRVSESKQVINRPSRFYVVLQ